MALHHAVYPVTDPTEIGFHNHIRENPTDYVARLVYADWLQEQGRHPPLVDSIRFFALNPNWSPVPTSVPVRQ